MSSKLFTGQYSTIKAFFTIFGFRVYYFLIFSNAIITSNTVITFIYVYFNKAFVSWIVVILIAVAVSFKAIDERLVAATPRAL